MNYCIQQEIDHLKNCPSVLHIDDINFDIINDWQDNGFFMVGFSQFRKNSSIWKFNYSTRIWVPLLQSTNMPKERFSIIKLVFPKLLLISSNNSISIYVFDIERKICTDIKTEKNSLIGKAASKICKLDNETLVSISKDMQLNLLNLNTFQWDPVVLSEHQNDAGVPSGRIGFEIIVYDRKIFIFGGRSFSHCQCSFDVIPVFDKKNNIWNALRTTPDPLHGYPEQRQDHNALYYDDFIYIVGGISLSTGRFLNDIWQCHVSTLKWRILPYGIPDNNMNLKKCTVTNDGQLLICGYDKTVGFRKLFSINLNQHFIPRLESIAWKTVTSMMSKLVDAECSISRKDLINLGLSNYYVSKICW